MFKIKQFWGYEILGFGIYPPVPVRTGLRFKVCYLIFLYLSG